MLKIATRMSHFRIFYPVKLCNSSVFIQLPSRWLSSDNRRPPLYPLYIPPKKPKGKPRGDIQGDEFDTGEKPPPTYDKFTGIEMPYTVRVLTSPKGSRVYIVGTAHISKESQDDVSLVIRAVKPTVLCLELCEKRISVLENDEQMILQAADNINLKTVRKAIRQQGLGTTLVQIMALRMNARHIRELGVASGGEFRRAVYEVQQLKNNCAIHLSDRPIDITMNRALGALTWKQKMKLIGLSFTPNSNTKKLTKEEIERIKQAGQDGGGFKEMEEEFPEMMKVMLDERDIYLTYSLQLAAVPDADRDEGGVTKVVGVVGLAHVPGIVANWGKVTEEDVTPLLTVP